MNAVPPATPPPPPQKTWWPTWKWWASTILAVAGILSTVAGTGWDWSNELWGATITLAAQRIIAYLIPNLAPASFQLCTS